MKKHYKFIAAAMAAFLVFGSSVTVNAGNGAEKKADYTKNENVYASLTADGKATDAYIVNHFSVKETGSITDYGNYAEIKNLSTLDRLEQNGNQVEFTAPEGEFYYQGLVTGVQLPWKYTITYQLDGKEISAEELAGKDGKLKITFRSEKNEAVEEDFYNNYLMQISLTLDCTKAKNVIAEGATIADAGADRQLSFTVLPGSDAEFAVEAEVTDFTMSGFSIAAVPYSMSMDLSGFDLDDFTGQISELEDAVNQLNEGTAGLKKGLDTLCGNNADIRNGSLQLQNGINTLSSNSATIVDASSRIQTALATITQQLGGADFSGLSKLSALPGGLNKLADALDGIQNGLTSLNANYTAAYAALDQAMQSETGILTDAEWAALQGSISGNDAADAAYRKLQASYQQLQTVKATYQSVKPVFDAVSGALAGEGENSMVAGLGAISANIRSISKSMSGISGTDISGQMNTLKNGLATLSSQYGEFHKGLVEYTEGLNSISQSYGTFHNGISSYLDGTVKIKEGASELSDGMGQFAEGIGDMPSDIENTVNEMITDFAGSDFEAVSFADDQNHNITSVQFVISTKGIEKTEAKTTEAVVEKQGFWDRLKALFVH